MKTWVRLLLCMLFVSAAGTVSASNTDSSSSETSQTKEKKDLKLKDLMPEKSVFGPSARNMTFSFDGNYAAYLYRPYAERRHGNDIHLYDVAENEVKRLTWPSVLARFQQKTRKVTEDRIEKAKKNLQKADAAKETKDKLQKGSTDTKKEAVGKASSAEAKQKRKEKKRQEQKERRRQQRNNKEAGKKQKTEGLDAQQEDAEKEDDTEKKQTDEDLTRLKKRGDWVGDKDADDEKAPRYQGIDSLAWSPTVNRLLFTSDGDIYAYDPNDDAVSRITQTRGRESSVTWLRDGSGFLFRRDGGLFRFRLSDRSIRQLDPRFPNGETMHGYRLSPDGRHLAFLTDKEVVKPESSKVEIANYRSRMMKAKEVNRHVSDDKLSVHEKRVYLYSLSDTDDEKDTLTEVYMGKTQMPDDMVKTPVWSTDSQRIAFCTFQQDDELIRLFEAKVPEEKEEEEDAVEDANQATDPNSTSAESSEDTKVEEKGKDKEKKDEANRAKEIFRFLHHGGPNTPRMMVFHYLADSRRFIYLSEQSGFRHLHLLDPLYESSTPLTSGPYEVYPLGISKDRGRFFFESTEEHPSQLDIYRLHIESGEVTRLTTDVGRHTGAALSQDGTRLLTNLESYEQLKELLFIDTQAKKHRFLTDSHPEKAHAFAEPSPAFFDFQNRQGHRLYGMMFKPEDWQDTDKRPVLIYFYGGPLGTRKMVTQGSFGASTFAFPYYMANRHGYVACTVDTRGNSGYAGVFEKANFGQVGKPQVEDLVDTVSFLVDHHGVDPNRIGIHGWSFGGFQTQMCLYTEPNVFQVGIAGAGPTEWENYNSWYTRHTIGKSDPGKATLKEFSLLPLAKNLKGHLLLIHGMEDSNVLYQDTVRVYRELLKAGKETQVELFLDPTGGHGLGGDVKTLSRYRKYESFLLRTLGTCPADPIEEGEEDK